MVIRDIVMFFLLPPKSAESYYIQLQSVPGTRLVADGLHLHFIPGTD
jgi:hypothetical protein